MNHKAVAPELEAVDGQGPDETGKGGDLYIRKKDFCRIEEIQFPGRSRNDGDDIFSVYIGNNTAHQPGHEADDDAPPQFLQMESNRNSFFRHGIFLSGV